MSLLNGMKSVFMRRYLTFVIIQSLNRYLLSTCIVPMLGFLQRINARFVFVECKALSGGRMSKQVTARHNRRSSDGGSSRRSVEGPRAWCPQRKPQLSSSMRVRAGAHQVTRPGGQHSGQRVLWVQENESERWWLQSVEKGWRRDRRGSSHAEECGLPPRAPGRHGRILSTREARADVCCTRFSSCGINCVSEGSFLETGDWPRFQGDNNGLDAAHSRKGAGTSAICQI